MAIKDMKGTVTTTGMMNNQPDTVKPANLSGMNKLFDRKTPKKITQKVEPQTVKQTNQLEERIKSLTNEDRAVLTTVLSPSVNDVLRKIAPDLTPLLDAAGAQEENLVIPVSVVKNFATKRYGGDDERTAISNFINDLQQSTQMDQQPVPPDTQMANADSMMKSEIDEIDSGTLA
jgi:hypothetical protein